MCVILPEFTGGISPDNDDFEMCTMSVVLPSSRVRYPPIARISRCVLCVTNYPV